MKTLVVEITEYVVGLKGIVPEIYKECKKGRIYLKLQRKQEDNNECQHKIYIMILILDCNS